MTEERRTEREREGDRATKRGGRWVTGSVSHLCNRDRNKDFHFGLHSKIIAEMVTLNMHTDVRSVC